MNRRHFAQNEITEALQSLEAGVRLPEVCSRLGVSEATVNRWRREARLGTARRPPRLDLVAAPAIAPHQEAASPALPGALRPVEAAVVAAGGVRVAALEQRLEAFRQVLVTLLPPEEMERAARLLEATLSVSAQRSRRLLGLPPVNAKGAPLQAPPRDLRVGGEA